MEHGRAVLRHRPALEPASRCSRSRSRPRRSRSGRRRIYTSSTLRRAGRPNRRPHVHRERRTRSRHAPAGRRRREAQLLRVSYGSFLGRPTRTCSQGLPGARDRRRAGSYRVGDTGGAIPFSTRLRSDAGAMATLNEFFRLCDLGGIGARPGRIRRSATRTRCKSRSTMGRSTSRSRTARGSTPRTRTSSGRRSARCTTR